MSILPSCAPSTSTVPDDRCAIAPAKCINVVLPAPLGPRITQCSPGATSQSTPSSSRSSRPSEADHRVTVAARSFNTYDLAFFLTCCGQTDFSLGFGAPGGCRQTPTE